MKKRLFFIFMLSLSVFLMLSAQTQTVRAATNQGEPEPFTATTGLEQFSSYRLNFTGEVDGTKDGQPSSGSLAGFLDVTNYPKAQHLRVDVDGDTFSTLAPLGTIEVYDVDNTFYIQNPQDGSWITLPAFLVNTMLPDGVPSPEDSIELPVTAVPRPGREVVNGIVTQRYTFDADDLAVEHQSKYDDVQGTIRVAVDGNYIISYEATVKGQFTDAVAEAKAKSGQLDDLLVSDLSFIDEGTVTMRYDLLDVNNNFSIAPPKKAGGLFGFSLW
jgi:hypothetical protein